MTQDKNKTQLGRGIGMALTVLAGLMLIFSVVILVIVLTSAQSIQGYDIYFQMMGMGELAQVVLRPLQAGMINLGILIFIVLLTFSVLLAAAGWLVNRQSRLAARIAALEEKVGDKESQDR